MYRVTAPQLLRASAALLRPQEAHGGSYPAQSSPNGLSFGLTEQQLQYQDMARKFTAEFITPNAAKHDQSMEYPHEIFKKAWEQGLTNMVIPEAYGGLGASILDNLVVKEELCYGCSGIGTALGGNNLPCAPMLVAASEAQKKKYLGMLTEAPMHCSYCVTEPGGGSDVAGMKTFAKKQGDKWILNGQKMWITNGGVSDWYFVVARCDEGYIAFVVEKDWPGVIREKKEIMLGQRCSDTRGITFENVAIPEENVVGAPGQGFKIAMKAFDATRPPTAIGAVAVARRATDEATKYARERKSMGKFIAEHQAIGFLLADMAAGVEACRLLTWRSAWEAENGRRNTYYASSAKMMSATHCDFCTTSAIQVFGGNGYNTGYPVEKLYRDGKIYSIYEGTTQVQHKIVSQFVTGMRC